MKVCASCQTAFQSTARDWRCPQCAFTPENHNGIPVLAPDVCESHTEFDRAAFDRLTAAETNSFWFRARNNVIVWALNKYFPRAQSFLEVGCGTGFVLKGVSGAYPHLTVAGSDLSSDGLNCTAEKLPDAALLQMDALRVPMQEEFDVIGMFDVLEHIESDQAVLHQLFKAIKPGGGIMISVPQHMFLWSERDALARHYRRYSRKELASKLEAAGFRLKGATSFMTVLTPLMVAAKLLVNYSSNDRVAKDLDPGPLMNFVLGTLLSFEQIVIRSGASLPFGGSLLIVAERPAQTASSARTPAVAAAGVS